MPNSEANLRFYGILSKNKGFESLRYVLRETINDFGANITFTEDMINQDVHSSSFFAEIEKSDLILAEVSKPDPDVFYELGFAHALNKPIIFLFEEDFDLDLLRNIPFNFSSYVYLSYTMTSKGVINFRNNLNKLLNDFVHSPRIFSPLLPFHGKLTRQPFIDLENLDPREFENLCLELITQLGFEKVKWEKELGLFDALAFLTKNDPDGYQYKELWLISMGMRNPASDILYMASFKAEYLLQRILKNINLSEEAQIINNPVTLLLIVSKEKEEDIRYLKYRLKQLEAEIKKSPLTFRIRLWDQQFLKNLIQQYPQVGYKYFSEDLRRTKSEKRYRKTTEELYLENISLTEDLQTINNELEEEKKKRFIAERDAAWKDVAFKAAHKLGNPINAIETYLRSVKIRIEDERKDEALPIIESMKTSIEEAKIVIDQFKSLTKSQEINPRSIEIISLIKHSCESAEENGVNIQIKSDNDRINIFADPSRISECFNELVANSSHWFDKDKKNIVVSIKKCSKEELSNQLDSEREYLKINFEDNGQGIKVEDKEKIFAPFYTTFNPHGTGLGLSLVKWIIEGHDGLIIEKGVPGKGANFEIYIPLEKKEGE